MFLFIVDTVVDTTFFPTFSNHVLALQCHSPIEVLDLRKPNQTIGRWIPKSSQPLLFCDVSWIVKLNSCVLKHVQMLEWESKKKHDQVVHSSVHIILNRCSTKFPWSLASSTWSKLLEKAACISGKLWQTSPQNQPLQLLLTKTGAFCYFWCFPRVQRLEISIMFNLSGKAMDKFVKEEEERGNKTRNRIFISFDGLKQVRLSLQGRTAATHIIPVDIKFPTKPSTLAKL